MGIWGTAISSNNVFKNTTASFFKHYNQGTEVTDITNILIAENQMVEESYDNDHNFWFAIANAQWECQQLQPKIYVKVKVIIESGQNLDVWKSLGATDTELKQRKKVLKEFLNKLTTQKSKARNRKTITLCNAVFTKGSCLTFTLPNNRYGAAFVLEAEQNTEYGLNLIAFLDYNHTEKPTLQFFKNAKIIVSHNTGYDYLLNREKINIFNGRITNKPEICWCLAKQLTNTHTAFETIGYLKVNRTYSFKTHFTRLYNWANLGQAINTHYQNNTTTNKSKKLKLKTFRYQIYTWL